MLCLRSFARLTRGCASPQIRCICKLLSQHLTNAPNLFRLLMAIVKIEEEDLPLQRNQNLVVKFLMECRDVILPPAFVDDESNTAINRQRLNLMESGSDDNGKPLPMPRAGCAWTQGQLAFHIGLVDLFASCAEGENRFIESVCQTVFKIDELLEVGVPGDGVRAGCL